MGNEQSNNLDPQFNIVMDNIRKSKLSPKRMAINPEQKYKESLLQMLKKSNLSEYLKKTVKSCIQVNITPVQIIETVSVIMMLQRNNISPETYKSTLFKSTAESRHVVINFNPQRFKKYKPQQAEDSELKNVQSLDKVKQVFNILKAQITKNHHPFIKLTKTFTDYLVDIFLVFDKETINNNQNKQMDAEVYNFIQNFQKCNKGKGDRSQEGEYEILIRKLFMKWCLFIAQCCMKPYKKWVMNYTGMNQAKYSKWIQMMLFQQIWIVNHGYLFQVVSSIIQKYKQPLIIPHCSHLQLSPSLFHIDAQLQIEGNFFGSIFQISKFSQIQRPSLIMNHLTNIKTNICTDIDKFYQLEQRLSTIIEEKDRIVYEVNSDNILGIVAYILYRVKLKIDDILRQCIILRIIYGENVYYSHGQSSYMLSTIIAALDYLQGEQFGMVVIQEVQRLEKEQLVQKELIKKDKKTQVDSQTDPTNTKSVDQSEQEINILQKLLHKQII